MKNIVVSCGPIPAKLDSVKYITNRFKGGLAFMTASMLSSMRTDYHVTIVAWKHTQIPENIQSLIDEHELQLVRVDDVVEYCQWFEHHAAEYDAFVLAAAVANLMPVEAIKGKFPSHLYKVGDQFDIKFQIAPRAIDIIKKVNPRCTLIGYKLFDGTYDELISAARLTQKESKANIIFANTPADAKTKKYAVMPDNTVLPCSFDNHIRMIMDVIDAHYFKTEIRELTDIEKENSDIRRALAIVRMYEKTMNGFGTVAVPIWNVGGVKFATTSRGHNGFPVIVRDVDMDSRTVIATGKATLNAPTLNAIVDAMRKQASIYTCWNNVSPIIVHRHDDDPNFDQNTTFDYTMPKYLFPGTLEETATVAEAFRDPTVRRVKLLGHGDLTVRNILPVNWEKYYDQFPERYFSIPDAMQEFIDKYNTPDAETLEVGGNRHVCTKYAYDKYVKADNAINLTADDLKKAADTGNRFDLTVCKNAVNYLPIAAFRCILAASKHFVANTFLTPPSEKITDNEVAVSSPYSVLHTLRLPNDDLIQHDFFWHTPAFYEAFGLKVTPYGKNSALLTK